MAQATNRAIEAVWRIESARLIAGLAHVVGDVGRAEDLAQDALQASRLRARLGPDGAPVLLADQNPAKWDGLLVGRGSAALSRAESLARPLGPYTLQAAIAACHARARRIEDTDWEQIVALYDALTALNPSPIVELNRAVAVSMAYGPAQALELVDALVADGRLESYHLLPAVRADLLGRLGCQLRDHAGSGWHRLRPN